MADPITILTGVTTALSGAAAYKSLKKPKLPEQKAPADTGNPNDPRNRAVAQRRSLDRGRDSETRLSTFLSNGSGGLG